MGGRDTATGRDTVSRPVRKGVRTGHGRVVKQYTRQQKDAWAVVKRDVKHVLTRQVETGDAPPPGDGLGGDL